MARARSGRREDQAHAVAAPGSIPPAIVEVACVVLALAALHPLLTPGHLWGHDTGAHLFRLSEVARALREGVLYPRFLPDAYGGLGGPILNFNPVLPYYLPALLVLAGLGPIAALKISAGVVMILGGWSMRILARPHAGRIGAAVAGLAYVYLPYRIANLYVRMAYSEMFAMVVLPLAMAAARRAARTPSAGRIAAAAVVLGLLLATHFPTCVFGIPLVALYALWSAGRGGHLRAAGALGALLALALAIGAFAWLPALLEQSQTHYEESAEGVDNYRHHFLEWPQLLSTRWGFGSSMPGSRDGMSFQIGWVHLLLLVVAVAGAVAVRRPRPVTGFCATVVVLGSALALPVSKPIWDLSATLQNVQFPWRLLGVIGIGTSVAAGVAAALPAFLKGAVATASLGGGRRAQAGSVRRGAGRQDDEKGAPAPARSAAAAVSGRAAEDGTSAPGKSRRAGGSERGAEANAAGPWRSSRGVWAERASVGACVVLIAGACVPYLRARPGEGTDADFTPQGIRSRYFGEIKFQPREVTRIRYRPEGARATLIGGGSASIVEDRTHRMSVEIDAPAPTTLRLHLFHARGWKARIGGAEAPVRTEPDTGLVLVDVPAGRHRVDLRFGDTPPRRAGWILSAAGALAAALLAAAPALSRRARLHTHA